MAAPLVRVSPGDGFDINTPLLDPEIAVNASGPLPSDTPQIWMVTSLPKLQVFVLAVASLSEPVTVNLVYPFLSEMIDTITKDPERVPYYFGLLSGSFSLSQFCFVYLWGSLSDHIGRKPILLICLLGGALSTIAFGMSTTFVQMIVFRSITGAMYGDVPVLRSAMGDITDTTNQARAFSFIPLGWAIGSMVAPLIGGFLSNPARQFPDRFSNWPFFVRHPYALPCFVGSLVTVAGFILVVFLLDETLKKDTRKKYDNEEGEEEGQEQQVEPDTYDGIQQGGNTTNPRTYGATAITATSTKSHSRSRSRSPPAISTSTSSPVPHLSAFQILRDPLVRNVLTSYGLLALMSTSNDVVFVLWMHTPLWGGGVGFGTRQIATALTTGAILSTISLTLLFPFLHKHVGTVRIYRYAMALDVVFVLMLPLVHKIAVKTFDGGIGQSQVGGPWSQVPWSILLGVGAALVVKALASLTWGCNMILVTASVPSPRSLGSVNSLAQMIASIARAIGPPIYTIIFTHSMGEGSKWLGGHNGLALWLFMTGVASLSLLAACFVKEGDSEWRRTANVVE